jgi:hypothetical protein
MNVSTEIIPTKHAILSPSSAERWMACPASVQLTKDLPYESSKYADEGSAAHEVAAMSLTNGDDADAYIGRIISLENGAEIEVTDDMATEVQKYVDYVRGLVSAGGELMVEQRLSISHLTGEEGAEGTSDVVILFDDEIVIVDLKFGRGVKVDADNNKQLMIYASGAISSIVDLLGLTVSNVRLVIHQPRLNHVSEWSLPIESLMEFEVQVQSAAEKVWAGSQEYLPGESQCRWCKAKATCSALTQQVLTEVAEDFDDLDDLGLKDKIGDGIHSASTAEGQRISQLLSVVDLIEDWCRAVRTKAESELFDGHGIPGYKLVAGRNGARRWSDDNEAETTMKSMRLKQDEMYSRKLVTPAQAEKILKENPRKWSRLSDQITQNQGKATVVPESDKRPALDFDVADDFDLLGE